MRAMRHEMEQNGTKGTDSQNESAITMRGLRISTGCQWIGMVGSLDEAQAMAGTETRESEVEIEKNDWDEVSVCPWGWEIL